jgi:hypothetical protein
LLGISTETTVIWKNKTKKRTRIMGTINATCGLIHMKELKLQKLNYLKYRADGLYDSQNEKNNSS